MPPTTQHKPDLWDKLAGLGDGDNEVEVVVDRVLPAEDAATGYPIAGYCHTFRGHGLTRQAIYEVVRGGTYNLEAKVVDTREFFGQKKISFPGIPKVVLPGQGAPSVIETGKGSAPARSRGNGGGYDQGYNAGLAAAQESSRLDRLEETVRDLRGRPAEAPDPLSVARLILEAVPKGGNGQPAMSIADVLAIVDKAESKGRTSAQQVFDLARELGGDGDSMIEVELARTLGKLVNKGVSQSRFNKAEKRVKTSDPSAQAARTFVEIRDGISDILLKHFGQTAVEAAQTIRGSRSISELLGAVNVTVEYIAENADDDEPEDEPGGPDSAPGKKDV